MPAYLDLAILDTRTASPMTFARLGSAFAVERLRPGKKLSSLLAFRDRIDQALRGETKRPTEQEVTRFGEALFELLITGSVRDLFNEANAHHDVRIHLLSNNSDLSSLPWEFMRVPREPGPRRGRSVVRVLLGHCRKPPLRLQRGSAIRVVLAHAQPKGQDPIPWPEVEHSMKTTFNARLPKGVMLDVIRAATITELQNAVRDSSNPCHIFHFLGHGEVRSNSGFLLLEGDAELPATDLALLLGERAIQMVILSACNTSTLNRQADFTATAQTLLQAGIPVVLANQLHIPAASVAPFVGTFYEFLMKDGDIDGAVAEARLDLKVKLANETREAALEWGIPTLYRNIASDQFFSK